MVYGFCQVAVALTWFPPLIVCSQHALADVPWQSWKLETCTLHMSHVYLQGDVSAIPMPMSCQKQIDTHTHTSALHTISCFLSTPNPKICLSQDLQNCAMHKTDNSMKSPMDICWNVDKELRMDSPIHTGDRFCKQISYKREI